MREPLIEQCVFIMFRLDDGISTNHVATHKDRLYHRTIQSCADCVSSCCQLYVDLNGPAGWMDYRLQTAVPV